MLYTSHSTCSLTQANIYYCIYMSGITPTNLSGVSTLYVNYRTLNGSVLNMWETGVRIFLFLYTWIPFSD